MNNNYILNTELILKKIKYFNIYEVINYLSKISDFIEKKIKKVIIKKINNIKLLKKIKLNRKEKIKILKFYEKLPKSNIITILKLLNNKIIIKYDKYKKRYKIYLYK
ncbi:MAG: hypothetical protein RDO_0630 [Flavobacteriales endosymbiont of Rhyzopertha dominica]|nr:MAG: hypothetical protein NHG05_00965 [Candidatus Shikimatogenerans bostrichidophilus]